MYVITLNKEATNFFLVTIWESDIHIPILKTELVGIIISNVNLYLTPTVNPFKNKDFSSFFVNRISGLDIHAAEEIEVLIYFVTEQTAVLCIIAWNLALQFEILDTRYVTQCYRCRFRLWRSRCHFLAARHSIRYYFSHLL